ncbi:MAG TPA: 2-phospho-L-lactate guanylyltransferase [Rhizomicrobium sp.]|jgi:2-phospho-L-lactate guanylyltransferase|nr:2-phospho-L-lactate guanylyltransferase [Rhizomicrobium sp.]
MDLRIILPVKPFAEAKQRLAPAMTAAARARLAEQMFLHVFATARAFAGAPGIIVISRGTDALAFATGQGAIALAEQPLSDLNGALRQASAFARKSGAAKLLVAASDLPLLGEADLAALAGHDCAIAPDRHGRGTNALLWPATLDFHFGENSFEHHRAIASSAGSEAHIVTRPGLAHDIDVPADLLRPTGPESSVMARKCGPPS